MSEMVDQVARAPESPLLAALRAVSSADCVHAVLRYNRPLSPEERREVSAYLARAFAP